MSAIDAVKLTEVVLSTLKQILLDNANANRAVMYLNEEVRFHLKALEELMVLVKKDQGETVAEKADSKMVMRDMGESSLLEDEIKQMKALLQTVSDWILDVSVPPSCFKLLIVTPCIFLSRAFSLCSSKRNESSAVFKIGDLVECNFRGQGYWAPGAIYAVDKGKYNVKYDHKESIAVIEKDVVTERIRRPIGFEDTLNVGGQVEVYDYEMKRWRA